ncbi:MAG: hypothetical protein HRU23_05415 [Gammaproteobacteria bacterium]|nr:hypothetical protein [Gammaproteobacteria bacterium]
MSNFISNIVRFKTIGITILLSFVISFYSQAEAINSTTLYQKNYSSERYSWLAVSSAELDASRGGFILPNGIIVDISINKYILTNGTETYSYNYQSPVNQLLVQGGQLNLSSKLTNSPLTSIIQNSLDNQIISAINTINIDIRNLNSVNHNISSSDYFSLYVLPNLHN